MAHCCVCWAICCARHSPHLATCAHQLLCCVSYSVHQQLDWVIVLHYHSAGPVVVLSNITLLGQAQCRATSPRWASRSAE